MSALFQEDSDEELVVKINETYANKYDTWRKKEEISKLKARYGETLVEDSSSSSSEEDDDAQELTEQIEKDFFKTLSRLKQKDPSIYDESVNFFQQECAPEQTKTNKTKKHNKPMYLRDYERKIIVEQQGKFSDDEILHDRTLVEEQEEIRDSFKKVLQHAEGNDDSVLGGLFEKRKKTSEELKNEEEDFREWLKGRRTQLEDKTTEKELKYLYDYWNDPNLDVNELFLKDYILNKKFLEPEDENHMQSYDLQAHDSDDGFSEDEATIAKQLEFEHKYNFRFEEPDQEFLKRFPRTMENSMRKVDNRRKENRKQVRERKEAEKERMKEDLKRLKALKRKEILEKIEKLKEVTGNPNFGFEEDDVDGNFDPEKHDKRMSELFSQEYYQQEDMDELPAFPEIDQELEIENWDDWNGEPYEEREPHCEDPDFNMDCEYNPTADFQKELVNATKCRKRNKKSKLSQALMVKKPIFNPNEQSFEQYVNEYYGLDFEDVIGDLPCRFKYRKVVPNSFGLTVEEILMANDKELNRWCSVKRAVQHRSNEVEHYDICRYKMKAKNEEYKRKMLPSLYQTREDSVIPIKKKNRKNKKKNHKKESTATNTVTEKLCVGGMNRSQLQSGEKKPLKSSHMKEKTNVGAGQGSKPKKRKYDLIKKTSFDDVENRKKQKYDSELSANETKGKQNIGHRPCSDSSLKTLSRRKKRNIRKASMREAVNNTSITDSQEKKKQKDVRTTLSISDARLKAYGLKPKKFKNFLKYGKTV